MKRISSREASAIIFYRTKMRMSISHIAELTERSSRSIHRILCKNSWIHKLFDKRRMHPHSRRWGEIAFRKAYAGLTWFLELWKEGIISNILLLTGRTLEGKPPWYQYSSRFEEIYSSDSEEYYSGEEEEEENWKRGERDGRSYYGRSEETRGAGQGLVFTCQEGALGRDPEIPEGIRGWLDL